MLGWAQRWLQDLLTQAVGKFLDVASDSLKFSLRSGCVSMSNVRLRTKELMAEFPYLQTLLPVSITRGRASKLQLQIPWMNLLYGKIVLSVSGVDLVFAERREEDWEGDAAKARAEAEKQALLAHFEIDMLSRALQQSVNPHDRSSDELDGDWSPGEGEEETHETTTGRPPHHSRTNSSSAPASAAPTAHSETDKFNFGSLTSRILAKVGKVLLAKLVICVEDVHIQYEDGVRPRRDEDDQKMDSITMNFLSSEPKAKPQEVDPHQEQEQEQEVSSAIKVFGLRLGRLESVQKEHGSISISGSSASCSIRPGEVASPTTVVTLENLSVYSCTIDPSERRQQTSASASTSTSTATVEGVSDEEKHFQTVLEPLSCTISINVYHGDPDIGNPDYYDIQCQLTHLSVIVDNELLRSLIVIIDKMEIWQLRSVYGKFRPANWRTAATLSGKDNDCVGGVKPITRREWAKQGWHYALASVIQDIHKKKSKAQRLRRLKVKYPFSYGKYIQLYKQRLTQLASGVEVKKGHSDSACTTFLQDFEDRETAQDIIALRSHIGENMERDWAQGVHEKGGKSVQVSVLKSFWQNWMTSNGKDNSSSSQTNLNKISPSDFGDIQKIYDKLVEQMPRTPRVSTSSAIENDKEVVCSFDLGIESLDVAVSESNERRNPLMEVGICGTRCKIEVFENDVTKACIQSNTLQVKADGTTLMKQIDQAGQSFVDLKLEMQRLGEKKHLGVKVSCIVQPFICFVPPQKAIQRLLAFQVESIETYHISWLLSANGLETETARSHAKAQYLMQYPYVNFQLILSEACVCMEGDGNTSLVLRAKGASVSSSRHDVLESSRKAQLALDAVTQSLGNASDMVEEHVMYHRLNCTVSQIEVGLVKMGDQKKGEKFHVQRRLFSTSLWTEMELLLLPDDSTQAICKANVDFSNMKLKFSSDDLRKAHDVVQYNATKMRDLAKSDESVAQGVESEAKSGSLIDLRVRLPSITIDAYGFQGIQKPLRDNLRICIKGLKAGFQSSLSENECFVSICSVKVEQKTDIFTSVLMNLSLQELVRDESQSTNCVASSDLYSNASSSFKKVTTPEKIGKHLFKGTLNEKMWTSSSFSFALSEKKGSVSEKTIVVNAFCARINMRSLECALNVSDHISKHFMNDVEVSEAQTSDPLLLNGGNTERGTQLENTTRIHFSVTNYVFETDLLNDQKCIVRIPKMNALTLLVSDKLKSVEVNEEGLSMSIDSHERGHPLVQKFDINTKITFCDISSHPTEGGQCLEVWIHIPRIEVSLHQDHMKTIPALIEGFSSLGGKAEEDNILDKSHENTYPAIINAAVEVEFLQCEICGRQASSGSIISISEQLYAQIKCISGTIESFQCGWRLLGFFLCMPDLNDVSSRVLLASMQPKRHGNEIPIIKTNASGSIDDLEIDFKNVQVSINAFCWDKLAMLVEELKGDMEDHLDQSPTEPTKISMQAFKCFAEDLEININFENLHETLSPPVLLRTKLDFALTDDIHEYKGELSIHHLLVDLPLEGYEEDGEGEISRFKTFAFFDDLSISVHLSDSLDSLKGRVDLGSLSLWMSHQNLSFLKLVLSSFGGTKSNEVDSKSISKGSSFTTSIEFILASKKIAALFSDDRFQRDSPIAEMAICDISTKCSIDPLNMTQCFTTFKVILDFYNYDKVAWEPVVEEWPLDIFYRTCDPNDVKRKAVPSHELSVKSQSQWNINISQYTIETATILSHMLESLRLDLDPQVCTPKITSTKFTPYWLQNQTGMTVGYCFTDGSGSAVSLSGLQNQEEGQAPDENLVPLYIKKGSGRGGRYVSYSYMHKKFASRKSFVSENNQQQWVSGRRPVIHFKMAGSAWSESVAMNTYAKHCIMLNNIEGMGGKAMNILCDVQRRANGGRLIVLHSCISIINSLGYSIQIGSYVPLSFEPKCIHVLSPGESFWIPVQICSMGSICLRMVIDGKESSWSQQLRLHELTSKDAKQMKVLGNCIYGKGEITSFTVNVDQNGTQYKLRIEPPVKIRSLLPVPLDTVLYRSGRQILKSNIKPDSDLNIHNVRNSSQLSLFLKPRGYNWGSGINIPFSQKGDKLDGEGSTPVATEGSIVVQGTKKDDCPLSIEWKYIGKFPLIIQISCPLWIYNHTGLNLGVCDKDKDRKFQSVLPFWKENETTDSLGVGSVPPKKVKYEPTGLGIIASMAEEDDGGSGQITSSVLLEGNLPQGQKPANVTSWPTMFGMKAYHHNIKLQVRVKPDARLENAITSKVFNVQVLGEPTVIQVVASEDQAIPRLPKAYFFTVSTEISTVGGSSIGVHIRPRFILTNKLNVGIMYRQEGSKIKHELHSGGTEAIHADQLSDHPKLCVKLEDSTLWSGFFHLDKSGGIQMKMVGPGEEENMMLQVDVRELSFETWTISVSEYQAGFAPYRIDNFTGDLLSYYQYKCESVEKMLQPYSSAVYTWDEPYMSHKIVIKLPGHGSLGYFPLDAVGANHIVSVPVISGTHLNSSTQRNLQIAVKADGPTRVLAISDMSIHVPRKERPRLALSNQLLRITKMNKAKEKEETHPAKDSIFFLDVQVSHLGLSVIGKSSEILYLGILDLQLRFQKGEKHDAISFKTKRIQIDNMLPNATLPVLLSIPAPLYQQESSSSSIEAVTCKISYWHAKVASVTCVESAVIKVSPILLDIDGSIFFHLHHFTEVLSWVDETSSLSRVSSASSINGKEDMESASQKRLHFECIKISPIHMTVSLSTAGLTSEKIFLSENPKGVNAQLLYALAFAEFEGVQVLLSKFELSHALIDKATLQSLMGKHYIRALLREAVKILGSANVLGDPLGLVHHLGTGMWDFFSKPTVGLFHSARTLGVGQFTAGLSAGSWSLLSHTIYALSNAAWKISKTAHRNVNNVKARCDLLINSSTPLHRHIESNPSMLGAVSRGIGGIIAAPIHGMEQNGLQGLIEGTTLGVLGAFATPTATLLEFAQHTSKALRDMAKSGILKASRTRPPRIVSEDLPLSVYSLNEALGNLLLNTVCNGLYREEEQWFSCLLEGGKCILLTNKHVMSVKTTSSYDLSIEWLYSLSDIIEHSREGETATITILLPFQHDNRESSIHDSQRLSYGTGLPISQKVISFATELDSETFEECLLSVSQQDSSNCCFRITLPPAADTTNPANQIEMNAHHP